MRIIIVSDIHGKDAALKKVIDDNQYDKIIVLGDLFDYGFYLSNLDDNNMINLLKKHKDKLILITGNCDYYINYEKIGLYAHEVITVPLNGHRVTLTHGNRYSKGFLPPYCGDVFMFGHTHVPLLTKENNITYLNPGSLGKPRNGSSASYAVFDDDKISIKTLDGIIIKEMKL